MSVDALGKSSTALLTAETTISSDTCAYVAEYVKRMHLWQRYEALRGLTATELVGKKVQAQDLWLADPRVPSASGAITDRVTEEPAQLAVAIRLVRAQNHTLTERGRALRIAAADAVSAVRSPESHAQVNPMITTPGAGVILLFALLEADYDFLRATHQLAIAGSRRFTRAEVSARMGDVCRDLWKQKRGKVRTGDDRQKLGRLKELAESIESAGDAPTRGGARPPDQTSTVRLEPYVDLGLLSRTSRFDYKYAMEDRQAAFFDSMLNEPLMENWVANCMVGDYVNALRPALQSVSPLEQMNVLRDAWSQLRSQMGYASITETLLLANARLIDSGTGFFQLGTGQAALRELHIADPKAIRFTMARGGAVSYFKLNEAGTA